MDIKSISFENKNVIVQFGENYQQVPKITPEESTNKDLLYSSSDENVAKVDEHGLVTILSAGKATITATSTDGSNKSASYSISVPTFSSPDKFTATKAKDSFVVDYLGSDDINNITVKSNNNSIASVFYTIWSKEDNKVYISVEPKKVGTTTFVISDKTNPSIKSEVEITVPDTAITIPFNASKISKMFQKNGEEWLFEQQINSSDIITSLAVKLIPEDDGLYSTAIYGFYYEKSEKEFSETHGYSFTIDGHKYTFTNCAATLNLSTSAGNAKCAYVIHPLVNDMLQALENANEVTYGIEFEKWGIAGISVEQTFSSNSQVLKGLKAMAKALRESNYYSNLTEDTEYYESLVDASFSDSQ